MPRGRGRRGRPAATAWRRKHAAAAARFGAKGSASKSGSMVAGSAQGRLSSGRRRPTGLSPGIRNITPSRKNQRPDCQRRTPPSSTRRSGSTLPTAAASPWPIDLGQPRPLQRVAQLGILGQRHWPAGGSPSRGSSGCPHAPACTSAGSSLQALGQQRGEARGIRGGRGIGVVVRGQQRRVAPDRLAVARASGSAAPSAAAARRGTACPCRIAAPRPATRAPPAGAAAARHRRAWSGPCASVFHSGASMSSAAMKVGSPPMVSRTSPAASARSTRWPWARIACHWSSV